MKLLEQIITLAYRVFSPESIKARKYSAELDAEIRKNLFKRHVITEVPILSSRGFNYLKYSCSDYHITLDLYSGIWSTEHTRVFNKCRPSTDTLQILGAISCGEKYTKQLQTVDAAETLV